MKKLGLSGVVALIAVSVLQAGATEKAAPWIEKMAGLLEKPHTFKYSASIEAVQMGQEVKIDMSGDMAQADDMHYRGAFEMTMKMDAMPQGMNMKMVMVADGETAWVQTENPMMGGTQVMKLDLANLKEMAEVNPQIKNIQDMNPGKQLMRMTRLFNLDLVGVADGKATLAAAPDDEAMAEFLGPAGAGAMGADVVKNMTLILDEKTGAPMQVRLGEPAKLLTSFSEFKIVEKSSLMDRFSYTPPEGTQVVDLGAMMGAKTGSGN